MTLSKEPYKGTRDFYPEDMFVQKHIFAKWREVCERFGYVEYDSSLLEETALYAAKTGEEIVNEQTYSFVDRGGRDVTIRPEMTPTLARMVAKKRMELPYPVRWYSIPNLWRYEKPQRGRLREHWQLNVDLIGSESMEADAECIKIGAALIRGLGASDDSFVIKINHRKLMNGFMEEVLGLDADAVHTLSKLIDKKNKIPAEVFEEKAKEIVGDDIEIFVNFCNLDLVSELTNILPEDFVRNNEGVKELQEVMEMLTLAGEENIQFDPTIMRGFDYYTGIVFELFDLHPDNNRSLFGGGRYDELVGIFGVESVPVVGFAMGDVTARDFLEVHELLPEYTSTTDLYLCVMSEDYIDFANRLATSLRNEGINVAQDFSVRKFDKQLKVADKQGIQYFVCIGDDEVQSGKFKVKHLKNREEREVSQDEIVHVIKK